MIHHKPKSNWRWNSTEKTVIEGRNFAGREMLQIIFDLLKTWNEQKVGEFFSLLEQFFYTYSGPLLHDGIERRWGLPYDSKQVNKFYTTTGSIENSIMQKLKVLNSVFHTPLCIGISPNISPLLFPGEIPS